MSINNITSTKSVSGISSAMNHTQNTENKTLQSQISMKEQRLNKLTSDSELSLEEKNKEAHELKKQLAELRRKLKLLQEQEEEQNEKAVKKQEQQAILRDEILE